MTPTTHVERMCRDENAVELSVDPRRLALDGPLDFCPLKKKKNGQPSVRTCLKKNLNVIRLVIYKGRSNGQAGKRRCPKRDAPAPSYERLFGTRDD